MCELLHTSLRQIRSVFEMSRQSNFRNRAVAQKVGVFYRPIRHGDLRDTQTQPSPGHIVAVLLKFADEGTRVIERKPQSVRHRD